MEVRIELINEIGLRLEFLLDILYAIEYQLVDSPYLMMNRLY